MILRSPQYARTRRTLGTLMDQNAGVFESLGFTLWEYLNPEQVRREAEALGRDPNTAQVPTFGDVIGAAMEDTRDVVTDARQEIVEGAQLVGSGAQKLVLGVAVTAAIAGAIYFSQKRRRK